MTTLHLKAYHPAEGGHGALGWVCPNLLMAQWMVDPCLLHCGWWVEERERNATLKLAPSA